MAHVFSFIDDIAAAMITLGVGARIGYLLGAKRSQHDIEMIERHFETSRQIFERQHELQLNSDRKRAALDSLKKSYDDLAVWLHGLERKIDEIHAATTTTRREVHVKACTLIGDRPWETINPPVSLAASEFYWSDEVRRLIRKLSAPYGAFIMRVKDVMATIKYSESESGPIIDDHSWEARDRLIAVINEIRAQARSDLMD
ncbi:hypothetical protein [Actinacidiphila guanduensis]|uniref:hypothetical protein n=1 Tax=Actinacidiphila guanduensis TaxID=310781 RepID=UPI001160075B|nr:hypothetical protein [Actinacidiphila guanduensis]